MDACCCACYSYCTTEFVTILAALTIAAPGGGDARQKNTAANDGGNLEGGTIRLGVSLVDAVVVDTAVVTFVVVVVVIADADIRTRTSTCSAVSYDGERFSYCMREIVTILYLLVGTADSLERIRFVDEQYLLELERICFVDA